MFIVNIIVKNLLFISLLQFFLFLAYAWVEKICVKPKIYIFYFFILLSIVTVISFIQWSNLNFRNIAENWNLVLYDSTCFYSILLFISKKILVFVSFLKRSICTTETNFIKSSVFAKVLFNQKFISRDVKRKKNAISWGTLGVKEPFWHEVTEGGLKQDENSKASWFR